MTPDIITDWRDQALCAQTDPNMFHPHTNSSTRPAKTVCAACPVIQQCLTFALTNHETSGIWGGLTPSERRKLQPGPKPRRLLTHCKNGHAYTEGNTYKDNRGSRCCRTCQLNSATKRLARAREEAA